MKKKYILYIILASILATGLVIFMMPNHIKKKAYNTSLNLVLNTKFDLDLQVFYSSDKNASFNETQSVKKHILASEDFQTISYDIPSERIEALRIDFGSFQQHINIYKIELVSGNHTQEIPMSLLKEFNANQIDEISETENGLAISTSQEDPYLWDFIEFTADTKNYTMYFIPVILLAWILILYIIAKPIGKFLLMIYRARKQILSLAKSDFKSRFSGSYFGVVWGIIQPLMTIILFWFVFQVGFRAQPVDDVPFILWLVAGMIPWNFFSDAWFSGTGSFSNYSYIVKKLVFNIDILPVVRVAASSILNIIFNMLMLIIFIMYGHFPGVHIIDMVYFSLCLTVYVYSLSVITSTLNVFMKDIGQLLGILMQILMWMTPLMWSYTMIPERFSWLYKLNPLHYIINGYREALINGQWFFHHYFQMAWFWFVTLILLTVGHHLYNKLKIHFADVL